MEHTKEPWFQERHAIWTKPNGDGELIAGGLNKEDARRIVACVNACARFATDDLERFPLVSEHGFALYESVKKQRDELLAASQMALRLFDHEGRECREAIVLRRAIDNSTGETK